LFINFATLYHSVDLSWLILVYFKTQ